MEFSHSYKKKRTHIRDEYCSPPIESRSSIFEFVSPQQKVLDMKDACSRRGREAYGLLVSEVG